MQLGRRILPALVGALLWAIPTGAAAQTGNVAGTVVDEVTRAPLIGAQVVVGDDGSVTDEGGRFSITDVPAGVHVLRVIQLGYAEATRTITVTQGQTTVLELALGQEAIELGELVVIGYGQQSTNELTSSIDQIGTEEFNTGRVVSPEQLIQGKVAGVNIIDSGEPGGGIAVRIRGGTSIAASNDPLYVVDGVPLQVGGGLSSGRNPLNFLNPADIESMTILKDASATAIYGSRGANGVVLIETRGGRGTGLRGSQLSYSGSISSSAVAGNPDMLDPGEFRTAVEDWGGNADQFLGDNETDWFDEIQRTGVGHDHNIAFEGGAESLSYRFSVGYLNQEGVVRGSATERATVGINYGQNFFESLLRITANIKGAHTQDEFTPGGVIGGAAIFNPTVPVRTDSDTLGGFFEFSGSDLGPVNPVGELELVIDEGRTFRSVGDVEAQLAMPFLRALTGTVRLGYDVTETNRQVFRPSALFGETRQDSLAGYTSHANNTAVSRLFETFLNYGTRLGSAGDIDFTGGYTYDDTYSEFPFFEARGLEFDYLETSGIPAAQFERTTMWVDENRLISFFGRSNLNLFDRYLVTLSVRRDGSSRFGPDEQWGTFPSVAVAWRLSDETWAAGIPFFNNLKVRGSWGVNGNQAFANNLQFSTYSLGESTAQYQFGDVFIPTIRPSAADPGIKWEETTSWNLGLDWSILSDRVSGAIDYYFKETEDLIFSVPVPAGSNLSNFVTTNIGTMQNQGFEFSLDAQLFGGEPGDFYWIAGLVASTNDNELVSINPRAGGETILTGGIAGGVGNFIQVLRPGEPVNSFYVYRHRRGDDGLPLYEDTDGDGDVEDIEMYVDQETDPCDPDDPSAGLCADGVINQDDRVPFNDPNADWIFGHTSRMGWRAFDASFTLRAHTGNHVYNNVASNFGHYRALRYVDVPNNLHRSVLETGFEEEQYFSDYYVEDASFLRMENLTLGYTLDPFQSGQQVRLFGTVQNVFTMTEYRGVDPLAGLNGIDNNLYPRSRTFIFGANVAF